jgi:hypothetical protein
VSSNIKGDESTSYLGSCFKPLSALRTQSFLLTVKAGSNSKTRLQVALPLLIISLDNHILIRPDII